MNHSFERGLLLFRQGRYGMAVGEFSRLLAESPNDAGVHALLALCHAAESRWADAQREADAAVGLDPELPLGHHARATVLLGRGRLVHAGQAAREALRLDPHDPDVWALRAVIAYNTGMYAGAADAAARGLAVDPGHVECLGLRARALNHMTDADRAAADESIRAALKQGPDDAGAHCDAGRTLLGRGRPDEASGFFREALRLDPTSADARDGLLDALRRRHPLYRLLLRFLLCSPGVEAVRRVVGPILALGGALVVWKGAAASGGADLEEIVFGALFLAFGAALLLGEPVLNWLIARKRW
jgi:Flp pilus assembly protein TadD